MKKILRRGLLALGGVTLSLTLVLVGVIVIDGVSATARLDGVANTRIPNPRGPEIRAFVARPSAPGSYPAVIMLHEFWGLTAEMAGKAQALADEGYIVIAPDVYRGSSATTVPRAIFQVAGNPGSQIDTDLDAIFAWLVTQPGVRADRIGVMGFCAGGANALRYSLGNSRLAATAVFYGQLVTDPSRLKALPGPVLGIFGEADTSIPLDTVRAFEQGLITAGVPAQISIYPGQPHAFLGSVEDIRRGGPQGQAWSELTTFLKNALQGDAPLRRNSAPERVSDTFDGLYWLRVALLHASHSH